MIGSFPNLFIVMSVTSVTIFVLNFKVNRFVKTDSTLWESLTRTWMLWA